MDADRWGQIKAIFYAAAEQPADERAIFIRSECDGDESLAVEVESLLAAHDRAGSFIEALPTGEATMALEDLLIEPVIGRKVGPYKVIDLIGRGGMGEVYLAQDSRLGRKVALKLLPAQFTALGERVRRFEQEARSASSLNHPNIITVHDIGEIEGKHYLVTEYVEGETLRERMESGARQRIELSEALEVATQVAAALAAAHEAGIAHRDIKPENIMVRPDGLVKVLDFGLAKLTERSGPAMVSEGTGIVQASTESGVVMGTPRYMSPEQARGQKVDARTDIWSLGVVLYEMIGGRAPFGGGSTADVMVAILEKEPVGLGQYLPGVPEELERIVRKALRKDREERYQVINDMALDLRSLKEGLEFEAKLERSAPPEFGREAGAQTRQAAVAAPTGPVARSTLSAEYLINGIKQHKRVAALALAALAVAVAAAAYFYSLRGGGARINSMAILPFVDAGSDPDTEYLSDGITESLTNSLSQLPNLRMIARTSALRYKGRETDPQTVARELGVQAVLTGRVVRRADSLSISAELVDARDNSHIWGEQYSRRLSDVLVVQQEIAREIAERLRARLTGEERQRVTRNYTENVQAYQLYLRGRHHWNKRTAESWRQGIAYFQQAIDLDPNYALAYSGLADCYSDLQQSASALTSETLPRARAAALRALELDPSLAEAHASLGFTYLLSWQWAEAERELKRAIELNPNYASARRWYGIWLEVMDRSDEALEEHRRAQELDPLSPIISANLARIYMMRGELDSAINECRKITELNPDSSPHGILGLAYLKQERHEEAIAEFEKGAARNLNGLGALGYGYAVTGRRSEALAIVKELEDRYARREVRGAQIANIYAGLGDKDQAFAWLERDFQERSRALHIVLKIFPHLDTLRSDPRFADLLRRMGLPY